MKNFYIAAMAAAAMLVSNAVMAADNYIGASFGESELDTGVTSTTNSTLDDEDDGFKVFAGFKVNPNISVEAQYVDFGEASLVMQNGGSFTAEGTTVINSTGSSATISIEGTSFGVGVLIGTDTGGLYPFVKVGLHSWDMDTSLSGANIATTTLSDDGTDFYYGVGASYDINETLSLRAEFETYDFDGEDVDLLSAGIAVKF